MTRAVYIIASGARPAADLAELVTACIDAGWDPCVGATPSGLAFLDVPTLTELTGRQVRSEFSGRTSGWPPAAGVICAPATINTVDKFAAGIADNWAACTLIECWGQGAPVVLAPNVNPWLARHPRFRSNIADLREWGVSVLWTDPNHDAESWMPPWPEMAEELTRLAIA